MSEAVDQVVITTLQDQLAALRAENARLRGALEEFLDDSGYNHMTDNELNFEIEQGNGRAPIILRARAALAIVG